MEGSSTETTAAVNPRHVMYTHVIYGLQALSILVGVFTAASVAGRFVFGWPSLVAVIMNYMHHKAVRGTWLQSHSSWQLRTFWTAAVLIVCMSPLVFTVFLIPFVKGLFVVVGIWATYRVARGWLALRNGRTMPPGFP